VFTFMFKFSAEQLAYSHCNCFCLILEFHRGYGEKFCQSKCKLPIPLLSSLSMITCIPCQCNQSHQVKKYEMRRPYSMHGNEGDCIYRGVV
jgi:hypothetical protein